MSLLAGVTVSSVLDAKAITSHSILEARAELPRDIPGTTTSINHVGVLYSKEHMSQPLALVCSCIDLFIDVRVCRHFIAVMVSWTGDRGGAGGVV